MKIEACFIKDASVRLNDQNLFYSPAVRFRRKFQVSKKQRALLIVCGLGYGYYYINGRQVTKDLFIAPVSDYNKTLWYNRYDVTDLLQEGENILCAHLGNGFYNENFDSAWGHNKAEWRDVPKLSLRLDYGENVLLSDGNFKVSQDEALYYNQLRSGEYYDSRKEEDWLCADYDDSGWNYATEESDLPRGKARICKCPPIREHAIYPCKEIRKNDIGYIFDFGQNFSGYIQIKIKEAKDTQIVLEYAEEIDEYDHLKLNNLNIYYKSVPFQTDKLICNGEEIVWKPKFTYHGFRYVQITGLKEAPDPAMVCGIFVHQSVGKTGDFQCSSALLNQIYRAGIISSWSNMFYTITDCPTREKLGWTNDAAASMEQFAINFDCKDFLKKWAIDLMDAMKDDGAMPGIVPSPGWGYDFGPVTDAILVEVAYVMYLYYGDKVFVRSMLPYCLKNLQYMDTFFKEGKLFLLGDWTGVRNHGQSEKFVQYMLMICLIKKLITLEAWATSGEVLILDEMLKYYQNKIEEKYLVDGDCVYDEQTAIAMLLCNEMGDRIKLGKHLLRVIANSQNHLDCGMVGTRYIYDALTLIGKPELVLEMICQPTPPSFGYWFENGATTLYETFINERSDSKNHHMFSNILAWFIKNILGLCVTGKNEVKIAPKLFKQIDWAKGYVKVNGKTVSVKIRKENRTLFICADIPKGVKVFFEGKKVRAGEIVLKYEY